MEVSMTELFWLACSAFVFGGALYLGLRIASSVIHMLSFSPKEIPAPLARRLPDGYRVSEQPRKRRLPFGISRVLKDFFACLFCGIAFIIFLFWQADGVPRLFVFLATGGGAYSARRLFSHFLDGITEWAEGLFSFFLIWLSVPIIRLLRCVYAHLSVFCKKIALFFIKRAKRFYTIRSARRYAIRAEKALRDKRIAEAIHKATIGKGEL